ncbi:MAG TPA: DUF333 domain-containing protein [Candidatus Pacearchaeota archaeon]|nr:DUF333 domain-containing protein [Candidatus Pacearchaeota archaeon]
MDKKIFPIVIIIILVLVILIGVTKKTPLSENKKENISGENQKNGQKENQPGIANPASQFCKDQGGSIEIRTLDDGSQYGVCIFKNGVECEEWDLFSGRCNKDGSDFCGESPYGACSDDLDCQTDGCSGQICKSKKDESFVTDCQIKECNDSKKYGLSCACQESKCQWSK